MNWLEASGHSKWILQRDNSFSEQKHISSKAKALVASGMAYPSFLLLTHEDVPLVIGLFATVIIYGLLYIPASFFAKWEYNEDSELFLIGLMESTGIKKVDYDRRHFIYEPITRYLVKYNSIAGYSIDKINWKEYSFYNLKIETKD